MTNDETTNMATEAQLEAVELDPPKPEPRGFQSLKGVRRSTYIKRSLLRMLSKSPEELEKYSPRNGFEMIARNMILASNAKDRNAAVAVAVFKECKESLGEKAGVAGRSSQQNLPYAISDLPSPDDLPSPYKMPKPDESN